MNDDVERRREATQESIFEGLVETLEAQVEELQEEISRLRQSNTELEKDNEKSKRIVEAAEEVMREYCAGYPGDCEGCTGFESEDEEDSVAKLCVALLEDRGVEE